jgi:hypothetical protein
MNNLDKETIMAIRPKKQTSSNRGETGGGAPRGGSRGLGGSKLAPKPKVELKPEPSNVTIKPGKYTLGPESAARANAKIRAERARTSPAKPSAEKSALKAANKPAKYKSADAARKQSIDKANKANAANKAGKGPKLTPAQMVAFRRGLTAFDKLGKKKSK